MRVRKFILCDVDHTVSNAAHRDDLIGGEGGWDVYHAAAKDDEPLHDVAEVIRALGAASYVIIGLTGRPEKWRQLTQEWMFEHSILFDELLMRPDDDYRQAALCKISMALRRFGSEDELRTNVAMLLDDNEKVTEAFRGLGITVLQVFGRVR